MLVEENLLFGAIAAGMPPPAYSTDSIKCLIYSPGLAESRKQLVGTLREAEKSQSHFWQHYRAHCSVFSPSRQCQLPVLAQLRRLAGEGRCRHFYQLHHLVLLDVPVFGVTNADFQQRQVRVGHAVRKPRLDHG